MEIYCIFIIFITITSSLEITGENVQNKILNYFKSDTVRSFEEQWQIFKKPIENAISLALKEIYGHKGMNVYIRKMRDPHKINKGYYHSDNQVQIILKDLELDNLPYISMPQVTFPLSSNVLRIDASLSKMIIRCDYMVFRNQTNIIYGLKDQNVNKDSPFTFQQTKTKGQLGIIIDGCVLSGFTVATLTGPSVNLGHDNFNIYNCHHTLEIYNNGTQAPPVFASYYPSGEGLNIEQLLMVSLREELMPKLVAAMFSYVNTSAIFGNDLSAIRGKQQDIFRQTATFMTNVTRNMNKITIEKNLSSIPIGDFSIKWDDLFKESSFQEVKLKNMVLSGLDTAYSSHTGGPISTPSIYIAEQIRFPTLQVNGMVDFKGDKHASFDFFVEIKDMTVSVLMELNTLRTKKNFEKLSMKFMKRFEVIGWRSFEFSASGDEIISIEALVNGHLLKKLPELIIKHLNRIYNEAVKLTNNKSDETLLLTESDEKNAEQKEKKENNISSQSENGAESDENERMSVSLDKDLNKSSKEEMLSNKTAVDTDDNLPQENSKENNSDLDTNVDKDKDSDSDSIQAKNSDSGINEDEGSQQVDNKILPSESSEQVKFVSQESSENKFSSEVKTVGFDGNKVKQQLRKIKDKLKLNSSKKSVISSKNISGNDITHLINKEIRSDFR